MKPGRLLLFYCLLFTSVALAQEDTSTVSLTEVVVTALRRQQHQQSIPYATNTLSRKELNIFHPRTTPEALTGITGVFVQKTNHGGGSPFVRGLTGNQTLLLVDGIRLNNSTFRFGPNQYLNTIDQFSIQKIEVVKGTGSVQYGSDALGGVIQVFTREPQYNSSNKHKISGNTLTRFMSSNMEQTARAQLNYGDKSVAATAGFTYRNFGDVTGGDTTGKQTPSGYKEMAFDAKLKFKLSSAIELIGAHQFVRQQNVPVFHKVRLENFLLNEMGPQQRMLSYAKLRLTNKNKWVQQIELTASHQQTIEQRTSQKNGSAALRKERDEVNTIGFSADVFSSININWTANSGVDVYADNVQSTRQDINISNASSAQKRGLYPDDSKYGNYSFFTLHQYRFKNWQVNAGLRFNSFAIRITDTSLGKVKVNPSALVGNITLLYTIEKKHSIYASFNNSYRSPNIDDMGTLGIVDFRYEVPAYDLQPEQSFNYEMGYKFSSKKIYVAANVFYTQLQNLITRIRTNASPVSGYNVYIKENTDKAFIRGAEAEADVQLIKHLRVEGNLTYLYGLNKTRNEPLRRIPPMNGRVRATYEKNKLFATGETWFAAKQNRLAQGDKEDNRIPAGGTPGFNVVNFYGGYSFKNISVQTGLQNLLNKDYRTHGSGINGAGRSVWLHIELIF